jgi:8-oxo-dGTP pyrophosphatase MutT (NUDIX family)
MSTSKSMFQHSAGGLVIRGDEVLLISTRGGTRWQLPKGHLESGETALQAAVREVEEETGVLGEPVRALGMVEYDFTSQRGLKIHKRVDYYLMRYEAGSARNYNPTEVSGAQWFPWRSAIDALTFENEKNLVTSAWYRGPSATDDGQERSQARTNRASGGRFGKEDVHR